ncbi:hypothetical protein HMPREF3034_01920 [Prevotella sp. DNF00663]|nr:hypothetical protein HMPREF3034_01920 [Prevotella sp. DNF00663]
MALPFSHLFVNGYKLKAVSSVKTALNTLLHRFFGYWLKRRSFMIK